MFITERFELKEEYELKIRNMKPNFGFNGLGEFVYYRTYSRIKDNGEQENWADTVIRVINGIMSIRKNHYVRNHLQWDNKYWQDYGLKIAIAMFKMEWLPAGRGLWVCGTEYCYERGSMALNNCAAVDTQNNLIEPVTWAMDALMNGVGVGFSTYWNKTATKPDKNNRQKFVIPDTREGWVESVELLLNSYIPYESKREDKRFPTFDYSKIRKAGLPIRTFGGLSSGPEPLVQLHKRIEKCFDDFCDKKIDSTRLVTDIFNSVGVCIVSGNVRRSAEIAQGLIDDDTFYDLKNYKKYPERAEIGWMSNNSVVMKEEKDFHKIPEIAKRIRNNGEPGILNLWNIQKYGRYGKKRSDKANLTNPCGEISLESYELCNLSEVFPPRCKDEETIYKAMEYATFYSSTIALLPTHSSKTNAIIARNRRIGVSVSGIAQWCEIVGFTEITRILRLGYKKVRNINQKLAREAGIPESIKVTTVKPSGTISLLSGCTPGIHFPTFKKAIRRVRVAANSPILPILVNAGVPNEDDTYSQNTKVFEFIIDHGKTRPANEVSAWEQFSLLAMMQRTWSDNSVSATIYFEPETEGNQLEYMLAQFIPVIKSVSMLPHTKNGVYAQSPYEGITDEEYENRKKDIKIIDWTQLRGSQPKGEKYCTNDKCTL